MPGNQWAPRASVIGPRTYVRGREAIPLRAVQAQAPAHLVLVYDRVGIAAGDTGVVGEPVGLLFAAEERGASFDPMEPLSEGAAGCDRNARNEAIVQIR